MSQKSKAQLINQDSGQVDWYTPGFVIEAARAVLGGIDLDPASCYVANDRVRAARFYTVADDGLSRPWFGRVWMNHPYSKENNQLWPAKLIAEYRAGRVSAACCITFAATSESWFQPFYDFPICFLSPRTNFFRPDGEIARGASKGAAVTYFGADLPAFVEHFAGLGRVMVPAAWAGGCYHW